MVRSRAPEHSTCSAGDRWTVEKPCDAKHIRSFKSITMKKEVKTWSAMVFLAPVIEMEIIIADFCCLITGRDQPFHLLCSHTPLKAVLSSLTMGKDTKNTNFTLAFFLLANYMQSQRQSINVSLINAPYFTIRVLNRSYSHILHKGLLFVFFSRLQWLVYHCRMGKMWSYIVIS